MKDFFKMCPSCGSRNIQFPNNRKWVCPDCGFELYNNVAAATGVIFCDDENNILFELRAREPKFGCYDLPGGFLEPDETAEDAAVRECREELGVEIKEMKYICTNPNTYEYKGFQCKTCDIYFVAKLPPEYKTIDEFIKSLKIEEEELSGLVSVKMETEQDVDNAPLAFESARKTLKKWIKMRNA